MCTILECISSMQSFSVLPTRHSIHTQVFQWPFKAFKCTLKFICNQPQAALFQLCLGTEISRRQNSEKTTFQEKFRLLS